MKQHMRFFSFLIVMLLVGALSKNYAQDTKSKSHINITVIGKDGKKHTIDEKYNGKMPKTLEEKIKQLKEKTGLDIRGNFFNNSNNNSFFFKGGDIKIIRKNFGEKHLEKKGEKKESIDQLLVELFKNDDDKNVKINRFIKIKKGKGKGATKSIIIEGLPGKDKLKKHNRFEFFFDKEGDENIHKELKKDLNILPQKNGSLKFFFKEGDHDDVITEDYKLKNGKHITITIYSSFKSDLKKDESMPKKESASEMRKSNGFTGLSGLNLYPNPSNGEFNLKFNLEQKGDAQVIIYDMQGRTVFQENLPDFQGPYYNTIDLSNNKKGIYILRISQNGETMTKKIKIE